ncbi:hypothetical protein GCM10023334_099560 [Nonomuraea thailandensis]
MRDGLDVADPGDGLGVVTHEALLARVFPDTRRRAGSEPARRECQAVSRFGSFHPGRGKWQV